MNDSASLAAARGARWLLLSLMVIVADQVSKAYIAKHFAVFSIVTILPVLEITHMHNTGAAFSLLASQPGWQRWFFTILGIAISLGIIVWLVGTRREHRWLLNCALALILGGALGNVIDRVSYGYVIDFIQFHWNGAYFPAFNVADSAITVGAAFLLLDALFEGRRKA
jgi:signal peptidase II